jgi:hypothetical protein
VKFRLAPEFNRLGLSLCSTIEAMGDRRRFSDARSSAGRWSIAQARRRSSDSRRGYLGSEEALAYLIEDDRILRGQPRGRHLRLRVL